MKIYHEISENKKLNVEKIKNEIKKTLDDNKTGEIIREGFKIAIIGPPNVGKSSLLNYLSKREVAIVSEKAGTTRDVIEKHLDLAWNTCYNFRYSRNKRL